MVTLTNNSGRDRGVPVAHGRNVTVERGASIEISDADAEAVEKNSVASQWLKAGYISLSDGEPATENNDDARKEQLIAELAELGVKKTKRASVETLEQALDDALNAPAADEPEGDEPEMEGDGVNG